VVEQAAGDVGLDDSPVSGILDLVQAAAAAAVAQRFPLLAPERLERAAPRSGSLSSPISRAPQRPLGVLIDRQRGDRLALRPIR
jgi:hypothetical protein